MAVAALLLALAAGSMPVAAAVQSVPGAAATAAKFSIDLPAQPLADALRAVAQKAGVNILFDPAVTKGLSAPAVSGSFTVLEALARLLAGTGLRVESVQDGTLAIKAEADKTAGAASPAPATVVASAGVAGELQRVEVTGSRLKRIDAEGPLPVNVYSKEDIQRSGQPTLERFLNSLNEASSMGEGTGSTALGQGTVQMRGLPLGSTVVLINGRRVEAVGSSSGNYFNISLIPMAAIERVELLPVGSSAVYGGDALAGVVNVILKKSMDGVSLDARVGSGKGVGDASVSLAVGKQGDDGSFLLLGSFSKTTPLLMKDREFFRDMDYRRFGGVDLRAQRFCGPGTVTSANGANLPGLNSAVAGIPTSSNGQKLTVADFAATAGKADLCGYVSNANGFGLVYGSQAIAMHAVGDYRLFGSWSAFGELTYTQDRIRVDQMGLPMSAITVPASNAFNPFGVPVLVSGRLGIENGLTGHGRDTDFTRALVGLRGSLTPRWELEASLSTSIDSGGSRSYNDGNIDTVARATALASPDPATALNPFTTGKAASDAVLQAIWTTAVRQNYGQRTLASAFARGSVADLPAGSMDAIVGMEYSTEQYKSSQVGSGASSSFDQSRQTGAVYGELRAPLLRGGGAADKGWEMAALTLAGRRDRYSDFGSASTYQAGMELRPQQTLLLRAAEATSFKPPTLLQKYIPDTTWTTEQLGLVDPARGREPIIGGQALSTTNSDLAPESGRAYTWGAAWEPEAGSRLGFTAWRVRINGLISQIGPQVVLNNEALFPTWVTRAPSANGVPGVVTRVLSRFANIGSVDTAGIDLEAAHSWKTDAGKWNAGFSATRTNKYDVVLAPGGAPQSRLGRRELDFWAPQWKGRLSGGFTADSWNVGLTSRYVGAYKESSAATARSIGNFWVHDLAGSVNLKKLGGFSDAKAAALTISIVNLGNRLPEYIAAFPYYDYSQGDWRGRYVTARVSVDW